MCTNTGINLFFSNIETLNALAIYVIQKIPVKPQTIGLTFFRVELGSENILFLNRCGRSNIVFTGRRNVVRVTIKVITVDKIKIRVPLNVFIEWRRLFHLDIIPPYMRKPIACTSR